MREPPEPFLAAGEHCAVPGCGRRAEVVVRGVNLRYRVCPGHEGEMWRELAQDGLGPESPELRVRRYPVDHRQEALDV